MIKKSINQKCTINTHGEEYKKKHKAFSDSSKGIKLCEIPSAVG
ncbi:hypothetical protein ACWEXZ_14220 [Staphylococcus xylosus]|nr:hypothetical protein [Staphylococcus xylosus]